MAPVESAEVVVIGGGALGASVAWHLRELGLTDVVLLERDTLGSGSTRAAAGGIRTQFADELNVRIALRSLDEFERMDGIDLRQDGYLFLLDRAEDVAAFEASVALQNELGVPSRFVSLDEAATLCPIAGLDGVLGATFSPLDGHASPEAVTQGYASAARAHGATILTGCSLDSIELTGGEINRVDTSLGVIDTGTVVCAAGVWSPQVAALVGLELPLEPYAREVGFTGPTPGLPDGIPLTVDFSTGFYFHREGPGLVFGGREPTIEGVATHATRRLPLLTELPIQSSWWGYYEMSPDHNALVGEAEEPNRFLYAAGFSGHGFQQCPAVGEYLAERIVGIVPTLNLAAFSAQRFAHGQPREEQFVI